MKGGAGQAAPPLRDVALAPRTTLGLGGPARWLWPLGDDASVEAALTFARRQGARCAILGDGSNTIVADAGFDGLVLVPEQRRLRVDVRADGVEVEAGAGLSWDELVAFAVRRDLGGVAALSGIPGRVGAAPVQNIGAYGEQLSDVFVAADVVALDSGRRFRVDLRAAGFGYRDSAWKRGDLGPTLITAVTLRLQPATTAAARYPDLRAELTARGVDPDAARLAQLRQAVLAVRRRKGMVVDPLDDDSRSVGSFFVNPVVSVAVADAAEAALVALAPPGAPRRPLPRYPVADAPGSVKLSAAALIEACGVRRGEGADGVAVSRKHVLALVHRGGGSATALLALAGHIEATVRARCGVTLQREPQLLGF